ncbi:Sortase family protein [Friedmanniella luteola]|uniref:Sortase family protein n=1 Tax=Friedmanniella luteola TaxID=546871 RepID=A0A1H1RH06_9ACTN|nr:class F sortase [Friedmanniella luteola]SDS34988.1 Sortase family protein [Friedmanniella luteola]
MADGGRRSGLIAAAAAVVLLLVGIVVLTLGVQGRAGPPQPAAAEPVVTVSPTPEPTRSAPSPSPARSGGGRTPARPAPSAEPKTRIGAFLPASAPTALDIPSVGIRSTSFVDLQVAKDGTLNVPGSADEVGLYADGPTPGQLGPAVLGAHVDSKKGPGVFYRLGAVEKGDKIHVTRRDKTRVTFTVDKVAVYPKDDFPTDEVYYGDFDQPQIRLVTCGGPFDPVDHYLSNVIVFGHRTS